MHSRDFETFSNDFVDVNMLLRYLENTMAVNKQGLVHHQRILFSNNCRSHSIVAMASNVLLD
jgi:hypothetical protein